MALGTILGTVLASAAASGAGALASKAFGGGGRGTPSAAELGAPLQQFNPIGINAGGLKATFGDNQYTVAPASGRTELVNALSNSYGGLADQLGILRSQVAPGVSGLRSARLAEIEDARKKAIGDLRENLSRRRVLGSSFGQDAIARAESEFGGARDRVAAESFLQELEMTNQLIDQQFTAQRSVFQTQLSELNLQADLATKLGAKATETLGSNAQFLSALNLKQAELAGKEAEGSGKFFGQLFQPVSSAIGKGVSSIFSSGFGSGGGGAMNIGGTGLPGFGGLY